MTNKQNLIKFLEKTNGKPEHLTWKDLASQFNIRNHKNNKLDHKAANDIWRNHIRKQKPAIEMDAPLEGLAIKKVWGKPGNFSYSYEKDASINTEEVRNAMIEEISKYSPKVKALPKVSNIDQVAYEISLPDFHIGRVSVDEAVTEFKTVVSQLLKRVEHLNLERIILPIGNDFFNADGINYTTTKGTPQFDVDEWRVTFRAGWRLLVDVITHLSTIAPVYVINVLGNHDAQRTFYLGDMLYGWFRNDANVTVNNSLDPFKFHVYGKNLIMFDHGELRAADYPLIMATEVPVLFSETKYREVHVGHLHKEMLNEYRGIKVRYLPSIAPSSQWEKTSGYLHQRCAQGLVWSKDGGLVAINQVNR